MKKLLLICLAVFSVTCCSVLSIGKVFAGAYDYQKDWQTGWGLGGENASDGFSYIPADNKATGAYVGKQGNSKDSLIAAAGFSITYRVTENVTGVRFYFRGGNQFLYTVNIFHKSATEIEVDVHEGEMGVSIVKQTGYVFDSAQNTFTFTFDTVGKVFRINDLPLVAKNDELERELQKTNFDSSGGMFELWLRVFGVTRDYGMVNDNKEKLEIVSSRVDDRMTITHMRGTPLAEFIPRLSIETAAWSKPDAASALKVSGELNSFRLDACDATYPQDRLRYGDLHDATALETEVSFIGGENINDAVLTLGDAQNKELRAKFSDIGDSSYSVQLYRADNAAVSVKETFEMPEGGRIQIRYFSEAEEFRVQNVPVSYTAAHRGGEFAFQDNNSRYIWGMDTSGEASIRIHTINFADMRTYLPAPNIGSAMTPGDMWDEFGTNFTAQDAGDGKNALITMDAGADWPAMSTRGVVQPKRERYLCINFKLVNDNVNYDANSLNVGMTPSGVPCDGPGGILLRFHQVQNDLKISVYTESFSKTEWQKVTIQNTVMGPQPASPVTGVKYNPEIGVIFDTAKKICYVNGVEIGEYLINLTPATVHFWASAKGPTSVLMNFDEPQVWPDTIGGNSSAEEAKRIEEGYLYNDPGQDAIRNYRNGSFSAPLKSSVLTQAGIISLSVCLPLGLVLAAALTIVLIKKKKGHKT